MSIVLPAFCENVICRVSPTSARPSARTNPVFHSLYDSKSVSVSQTS